MVKLSKHLILGASAACLLTAATMSMGYADSPLIDPNDRSYKIIIDILDDPAGYAATLAGPTARPPVSKPPVVPPITPQKCAEAASAACAKLSGYLEGTAQDNPLGTNFVCIYYAKGKPTSKNMGFCPGKILVIGPGGTVESCIKGGCAAGFCKKIDGTCVPFNSLK